MLTELIKNNNYSEMVVVASKRILLYLQNYIQYVQGQQNLWVIPLRPILVTIVVVEWEGGIGTNPGPRGA